MSSPDRRATNAFEHLIRYPIPKSLWTYLRQIVIAGLTGDLYIIRCPIRSGMMSINKLSEF